MLYFTLTNMFLRHQCITSAPSVPFREWSIVCLYLSENGPQCASVPFREWSIVCLYLSENGPQRASVLPGKGKELNGYGIYNIVSTAYI